ncbi:MAG: transcriptional repressor [Proteobacteria bacterium]|nr:transcriptional repressor [Pseudomonadota bacterium]
MKKIIEKLKEKNIKITPQRIAIIEFLMSTKSHPSAEDIYKEISKKYPSMSYATVYNTLITLKNLGEVVELAIDSDKKRFDIDTSLHHHFYCTRCKRVYDLSKNFIIEAISTIDGHNVERTFLNFTGICNKCLKEEKDEQDRKKS